LILNRKDAKIAKKDLDFFVAFASLRFKIVLSTNALSVRLKHLF